MADRILPDLLRQGLRVVFVGMNPGLTSARRRHYYAGPGNLFWPALFAASLTPRLFKPEEDALLPSLGIGLTDVVGRATASTAGLRRDEWRRGAAALAARLAPYRPGAVCFNGLTGARAVLGSDAGPGAQPVRSVNALTFVVPSTSRRNAAFSRTQVLAWFCALAALLPPGPAGTARGD